MTEVNLKVGGWITKLFVSQTGQKVSKGQPLFQLYSPDLFGAEQDFLLANQGAAAFGGSAGGVEGKMQDAAWRLDRREGPGVHLTKNSCTQRMGLKTRSTLFSH